MTYAENLTDTPVRTDEEIVSQLKNKIQTTVVTNVYTDDEFKQQFLIVFKTMADILSRTLGPYGASTMIDESKNFSVTKDGFHVLQNLRFADIKQNRIRATLYAISHQMVTKVGDGSTSAVVAAHAFLETMMEGCLKDKEIRPKEWNEIIQRNVERICDQIERSATPVTKDNLIDVVRNITNIATNENKVYTDMITEIYQTLGPNGTINITTSDSLMDEVVYEDGTYTSSCYLVDRIYHNKGNECVLKNCDVLMFDHTLEAKTFDLIMTAFNKISYQKGKTLIVIAPFYDQYMMDSIRHETENVLRQYQNAAKALHRVVFLKATELHKKNMQLMYADLAALLGATIYKPVDTNKLTDMLENYATECREAFAKGEQPNDIPQELVDSLFAHVGAVEDVSMGDKTSSFKGFCNKNEALFETLYHDAEEQLKEEERRVLDNDAVDNKVFEARNRFSKITCKSATIKVGGVNRLERSINVDAVDDAVKACVSAIKYGYNQGCNLAIIRAIDTIIENNRGYDLKQNEIILKLIREAFLKVYHRVLSNGMSDAKASNFIDQSISKGYICYNLAAKRFDNDMTEVINSCRTDIEILKGAIAMVGVVLTCNQYISSTLNH